MRRSSRLAGKAKVAINYVEKDVPLVEDATDDQMSVDTHPGPSTRPTPSTRTARIKAPSAKGPKTKTVKTKKVRGNRGKLAMLAEMPIDILFEVRHLLFDVNATQLSFRPLDI